MKKPISMSRHLGRAPWTVAAAFVIFTLTTSACFSKSPTQVSQDALTRGLQAQASGRLDEAASAYRQVLAKDPNNKWAHYDLGLVEQTQGQLQASETEYRTALNLDPNFEFALFNLAIVRTKAGAPNEALVLYRHVLQVNPNSANAHLNLGFLLIELKQKVAGEKELRRAVDLDPTLASRVPSNIFK